MLQNLSSVDVRRREKPERFETALRFTDMSAFKVPYLYVGAQRRVLLLVFFVSCSGGATLTGQPLRPLP